MRLHFAFRQSTQWNPRASLAVLVTSCGMARDRLRMPGCCCWQVDSIAFVCMRAVDGHMDSVLDTVEECRGRCCGQLGRRLSSSLTGVRILASGLCASTMWVFLRMLSSV